jgi:predicted N-acyltransferase
LLTGALPDLAEKLGLSSVHGLFFDEASTLALEQRGWGVRLGMQFQFHNPGHTDFEQFLGRFRSKRRGAIRRECRALKEQRIQIEIKNGAGFQLADARLAHERRRT